MPESIAKKIDYDKENSHIIIDNYKLRLDNDRISISDITDIDSEIIAEAQSSMGHMESITINRFTKIILVDCEIEFCEITPFNNTIVFENCLFTRDIKIGNGHNYIEYIMNYSDDYFVEFVGNNSISFKNTDIIFSRQNNQRIKVEHIRGEKIKLLRSDITINKIDGKFELLYIDSPNFNISSTSECSIRKFSSANNLEIYNLKIRKNDIFERNYKNNEYEVKMQGVKMTCIIIKDFFLKFNVKDVNFYDVDICFEGSSAALDIENLQSIATVWNPKKIQYRGFSHNVKNDKLLEEIEILAAQEFFSEMKNFFSKKGNSIRASEFYTSEMEAHKAYLIKKYPWRLHYEFIIAWSSKISSNFSQNWFRAFAIYILTGAIFAVMFYFLDECNGKLLNSWNAWCAYLANIYSPLTIRFEKIEEFVSVHSWVNFLWIFWKVIAGYLIYQMIVSSRKFVRF